MPDTAETGRRSRASGAAAAGYTGVFCGRPDQVGQARRAVARYLASCPVAGDAVLIASELAANAVVHSGSGGQFFTVRCELGAALVKIGTGRDDPRAWVRAAYLLVGPASGRPRRTRSVRPRRRAPAIVLVPF